MKNDKTQKEKKLNTNFKKGIIITLSAILILLIGYTYFTRKNMENYNNIKKDKSKYIVYSRYENTNEQYPKRIPYININSEPVEAVNDDIQILCNQYFDIEKSMIDYEYDINGIILSVVVKILNTETEYAPKPYFRTYNINLDTKKVIANEALLEYFQVNSKTVEKKIQQQFEKFYKEIIMNEYFDPKECNYSCFLKWRDVDNYLDNVTYYVEKGNLIAFKPFVFESIFGEENYFKDSDFEILIKKAEEIKE